MPPWAVIQVYLGNKVHRNDWDSPNEYIHLAPESAPASGGNNLPQIEKRDKHGYLASWQPTQEDMMACDWKLLSSEGHILVFDITLGVSSDDYYWGYVADHELENDGISGFGTLNIIQNKTDITKISFSIWHTQPQFPNSTALTLQVYSDNNQDSYQKMTALLKKDLYITVDDVTYYLGIAVIAESSENGEENRYGHFIWYPSEKNTDLKKLGAVMQQTGKTKRFYLNWR
ncbi:DUF2829 domain-containing protein [Xenorhabdus bovienii]|uniref:DUF2829 domain-containing protein n=1 Tax=Xenorhabdus bovienii TaxID=40576 RepID=A0AAJ1JBF3_XENBV|nr:MW1434 family type I TA system toxin [Xenorhabdus bovienii]MDE1480306.1 DUF2829 domain-containing protein [Xenorhabdus bovienii]MDE9474888.1 DUF2829 domain-containing protein [Xenorhabdus bovienii]